VKRLFWNTLASSADTTILIVLSLLATPIFIKYFGPAGYGVFVFLNIFSIYGALSFFDLGMEGALMIHIAKYEINGEHDKIRNALFVSLIYYAIVGVVVAAGIFIASDWLSGRFDPSEVRRTEVVDAVYLVALNALFQFLTLPFVAVLQGLHLFTLTKGISAIINIAQYVLLIAIAVWTHRIDLAFLSVSILTAIRLAVFAIFCLKNIKYDNYKKNDPSIFMILWKTSNTLFVNRLIGLVYNQIGKILIWWKLPIVNMAIYDVVNRPVSLIRVIGGMVYSATIPEVARLKYLNDNENIKILYLKLIRYVYILVVPGIVAISVNASRLLEAWISPSFAQYAPMVHILMLAAFITPVAAVASTIVVGLDMVKQTLWISVLGTLVNVVLAVILVETMGVMGLMIGVLLSELLMAIPYLLVMKRILAHQSMDLIAPLISIVTLAFGMSIMHIVISYGTYSTVAWLFCVGALILAHYCFEIVFLLESSERAFLLEGITKCVKSFFINKK
jgi:O-antigen/teichoic acid export membrane protein